MNGRCTPVFLLMFCFSFIQAQDSLINQAWIDLTAEASISEMGQFSISANPAGFLFFGPFIHAELGLGKHLRINTHMRFPKYGAISQMQYSHDRILKGYGIGGGLMGFIGDRKNKLYVGILLEYSQLNISDLNHYGIMPTKKFYTLALQAGYRVRYPNGFFVQYGLYLCYNTETEELFQDIPTLNVGNSKIPIPIPCPDIRFGFEF